MDIVPAEERTFLNYSQISRDDVKDVMSPILACFLPPSFLAGYYFNGEAEISGDRQMISCFHASGAAATASNGGFQSNPA